MNVHYWVGGGSGGRGRGGAEGFCRKRELLSSLRCKFQVGTRSLKPESQGNHALQLLFRFMVVQEHIICRHGISAHNMTMKRLTPKKRLNVKRKASPVSPTTPTTPEAQDAPSTYGPCENGNPKPEGQNNKKNNTSCEPWTEFVVYPFIGAPPKPYLVPHRSP